MAKKKPLSDDDFLRHLCLKKSPAPPAASPAHGAKPVLSPAAATHSRARPANPTAGARGAEFRTLLKQYLGSAVPQKESEAKPAVSRSVNPFKNLDHFQPDERLDLHQLTVERAKAALNWTFRGMREQKRRTLLLITGKGLHSPNGGVLKSEILHLLAHSDEVRRFQEAPARLGGSGALLVEIKAEV